MLLEKILKEKYILSYEERNIESIFIGNYENNPIESPFTKNPARRLEILSDKAATGANGNPTFRMTHTQQNPGAL